MVTKVSVRPKNKDYFIKCIQLRKQGLSYSEIRKQIPLAKSTIHSWLHLAGLTLTAEHLLIIRTKSLENHILGTQAAKITRQKRRESEIARTIENSHSYFNQTLFITGIMLYEAEGCKKGKTSFSNSDYRLIKIFMKFAEQYLKITREKMTFNLAIHVIRKEDLDRILNFWSKKLDINKSLFRITWKRNVVAKRRTNKDYVGQMNVSLHGESYLTRKLLAISDIILTSQLR